MTANGQRQIFGIHSTAIIDDPDQCLATRSRRDLDAACAGINGVFDKLLHNTCRPLDDLTGSDLIDQGFRQLMDAHGAMFRDSVGSAMFVRQMKREKGFWAMLCQR